MYSSWLPAFLLALGVTAGPLASLSTGCRDKSLTWERVKAGHSSLVPCPSVSTADEVSFKLFLNNDIIISSTWKSNNTPTINQKEGVTLQVDNHKAQFQLSKMQTNWTGLYRCEAEILYPPPYKKLPDEESVLIIEEEQCKFQEFIHCPAGRDNFPIWWAMVCMVLTVLSLVLTSIAAVLWQKLKSKQCFQNDYMNMKPRVFRKHLRVQHPIRPDRY
ncbi:hypothetical protein GN956_G13058 [Arapaima gigas]